MDGGVAVSLIDTQSYSLVLRDIFFAHVVQLPFFQGFKARRCKMLKVEPEHLPYLGLYIIDETMVPDGDGNATPWVLHTLKLGFSIIIRNNDPVACEKKLDEAWWAIMNGLWRDPFITRKIDTWWPTAPGPDDVRFEANTRGTRKFVWGAAGLNNEIPIGELQYETSVTYRAEYGALATDDFLSWHQETVPLRPGDVPIAPADEVQRIISKYEFTPATQESKP